jgi:hypothetical protein
MSLKKTPNIASQAGQMITEAILIMVLLMSFTFMAAKFFKDKEIFRQLITGPWSNLAGMIQNGVWAPVGPGSASHPNSHGRHIAIQGESAR